MRLLGSLVVLALASPVLAQPPPCSVTFLRVPDDVRHEIERWLAKEPYCSSAIELRVIATDSGTLYLIAQRPDGRIHEREVPDAPAAGVLVASWVADDWVTSPSPAAPVAATVVATPVVASPAMAPLVAAPRETTTGVIAAPQPYRRAGRWLSLTPMVSLDGGGLRADVDLAGGVRWTLGLGAAYTSSSSSRGSETTDASSMRLMVYAARAFELGSGYQVRGSVALARMWGSGTTYYPDEMRQINGEAAGMQIETAVIVARELGESWSLIGGPVLTALAAALDVDDDTVGESTVSLMLMAGVRYRL